MDVDTTALAAIRGAARAAGGGAYLGASVSGPAFAGSEHAVLVLGPPRSGKTSAIVVPSLLAAPGAVVSTSTKPDVMTATSAARRHVGPCLLYDPSGTVPTPPGVERVRWSPVPGAREWDGALLTARAMVRAAQPLHRHGSSDHWIERSEALLGPLLHAAALDDVDISDVLGWVDRKQAGAALDILEGARSERAADALTGIASTDSRELSGIWSTTAGVLAAYRSDAVSASARRPDLDPAELRRTGATLYICAAGRQQALLAPLVVGLCDEIRADVYRAATASGAVAPGGANRIPVLFALDEVANIAPLPDLPAMVSEGGGQGLVTLACLQDLSQGRARWGAAADGFLSLFGTTIVLPGIADVATLRAISLLAGQEEVVTRSVNRASDGTAGWRGVVGALVGIAPARRPASVTEATVRRDRLPPDAVGRGAPGTALTLGVGNVIGRVRLTPWFAEEPWLSAVGRPGPHETPHLARSPSPTPPGPMTPDLVSRHRRTRDAPPLERW